MTLFRDGLPIPRGFPLSVFRSVPYIHRGESWRLLSAVERELLLGYGFGHTRSCMSASERKQNQTAYNDLRLSLLGDSFSIYSFVIFALACSRRFILKLHYQTVAERMGLAPGFRSNLRSFCPLTTSLSYGSQRARTADAVEQLNRFLLLRKTNHTGSDIRVILLVKSLILKPILVRLCKVNGGINRSPFFKLGGSMLSI